MQTFIRGLDVNGTYIYIDVFSGYIELVLLEQKAVKEVIEEQVSLGIDYITDGEIPRENYINHFM